MSDQILTSTATASNLSSFVYFLFIMFSPVVIIIAYLECLNQLNHITDPLWPARVWQADQIDQPYPKEKIADLSSHLAKLLSAAQENKLDFPL